MSRCAVVQRCRAPGAKVHVHDVHAVHLQVQFNSVCSVVVVGGDDEEAEDHHDHADHE
jgi:hypothetical protein